MLAEEKQPTLGFVESGPPPQPKTPSPTHLLLKRHGENYRKRMGEDLMLNWARDGKLAKAQIKLRGLERCLALNDAFFRMDPTVDSWFTKDWAFPAFNVAVPELVKRNPQGGGQYGHLTER